MQARRERQHKVRRAIGEATRFGGLPSRRTLIVLLVIGVVAAFVFSRGATSTSSPALATSCTTPAAAVGSVNGSESLRYSITGPADGTYLVTIDAQTAQVGGDGAKVTPAGAIAVTVKQNLKDCKANGALPSLPAGPHRLVLFRNGTRVAGAKIPG